MFFFLMGSARHGRRPFSGSLSSGFQDLSGNSFRGELPECLKFLSQLRVLELDNNLFTGKIPLSWQWRLTHLSKFSQTCVVFAWGCKAHFLNQFAVTMLFSSNLSYPSSGFGNWRGWPSTAIRALCRVCWTLRTALPWTRTPVGSLHFQVGEVTRKVSPALRVSWTKPFRVFVVWGAGWQGDCWVEKCREWICWRHTKCRDRSASASFLLQDAPPQQA